MALDATKVVVGQSGSVLWGTVGITAPTSATATPGGSYADLGYLDEDGLTLTVTPNVQEFAVWQSRVPVRRENLAQDIAISGKLAEWNSNSVPKVFGGGTVTGGTQYAFPSDTAALDTFAICADVTDATDVFRFVFGRMSQTEAVESQFNRSNIATLSFSFGALAGTAGGSPGTIYASPAI